MSLWQSAKEFFHLSVPVIVDEEARVINVPAFVIPLTVEPEQPLEGMIAVEIEPERKTAVVKVALKKKKPVRKPVKVVKVVKEKR